MFGCQVGKLPVRYLGVLVMYAMLKTVDWDFLDAKLLKRLAAWISYIASFGARLTLVNSSLDGIPSYFMSMFLLNKTFIEKMNKHRRRFFWRKKKDKRAYHWVKWSRVCRSKKKGGLGIKDLHKQNISLLVKWWWKFELGDGLWQKIIRARYFKRKTVADVQTRFNDSPCWKAIMKVKEVYMEGRGIHIHMGDLARVWHDPWISENPLKVCYPAL